MAVGIQHPFLPELSGRRRAETARPARPLDIGRAPGTPARDPDAGRPNVPMASLILAAPILVIVASLCIAWRPGILASLIAIAVTPVAVFALTLGVAVLIDLVRHRT